MFDAYFVNKRLLSVFSRGWVLQKEISKKLMNTVQSLYVAYYGRPADPTGLQANDGNLGEIINAFGTSAEYTENLGSVDTSAQVNKPLSAAVWARCRRRRAGNATGRTAIYAAVLAFYKCWTSVIGHAAGNPDTELPAKADAVGTQ
ncbi:hypothetical protein NYA30BAC_01398 [Halomonas sp. NYA30]